MSSTHRPAETTAVRTFRAATLELAMDQIRRELGLDHVILGTEQLTSQGLFPWSAPKHQIEVTACRKSEQSLPSHISDAESAPESLPVAGEQQLTEVIPRRNPSHGQQRQRLKPPKAKKPSLVGTVCSQVAQLKSIVPNSAVVGEAGAASSSRSSSIPVPLAQETLAANEMTVVKNGLGWKTNPTTNDSTAETPLPPSLLPEHPASRKPTPDANRQPISRQTSVREARLPSETTAADAVRHILSMDMAGPVSSTKTPAAMASSPLTESSSAPSLEIPTGVERRIDELHDLVARLTRSVQPRWLTEVPPDLFSQFLSLVEAGFEEEMARELVGQLQRTTRPEQWSDGTATSATLAALIEREVRCGSPLLVRRGLQQVALFMGPTGVGKTTTLAKLAGRFALQDGLRVGLITVDTYRVAAADQLRAYADIIGIPCQIAADADELKQALEGFAEFDLVLIDTAGISPVDQGGIERLKTIVHVAKPQHSWLVLNATGGTPFVRAAMEHYAEALPTGLILTKLDELPGCGSLLTTLRQTALPVVYVTTGQEVPRDIEPANPCRIARLILGREQVNPTRPTT